MPDPNAKADEFFVFVYYLIDFHLYFSLPWSVFLLGRSDQKSGGAASQR